MATWPHANPQCDPYYTPRGGNAVLCIDEVSSVNGD